jgi:hypothetical protein
MVLLLDLVYYANNRNKKIKHKIKWPVANTH